MIAQFRAEEVLPGVFHIVCPLDVCVTLVVGDRMALLFDTAYGIGDLKGFIRTITDKRLMVLNSHHHGDHTLGNYQFGNVFIHRADYATLMQSDLAAARSRVLDQAALKDVELPEDFDEKGYIDADPGSVEPLIFNAVGLDVPSVRFLHIPGHTPGSLVLYIEKHQLLLTADNWNPTTWLFLKGCVPLHEYVANMQTLLDIPFQHVLCSHRPNLFPRERLVNFINGLTEETFASAVPADVTSSFGKTNTMLCHPEPGTDFFFDPENR